MTYNMTTRPYRLEDSRTVNAHRTSSYQMQPINRTTAPRQLQQNRKQVKRRKRNRIVILFLAILGAFHLISSAHDKSEAYTEVITPAVKAAATSAPAPAMEAPELPVEYIFRGGDGTPVDMQAMTNAWATEAGYAKRYDLTDEERWTVASVVTAEATGEPFAGMVAVAQCILQASEDDMIRPDEAVVKYKYTKNRPEPSAEALEAVQAVFDFGQVATTEPIKYYYAPALVYSEWHESQEYVMTINNHKFFAEG